MSMGRPDKTGNVSIFLTAKFYWQGLNFEIVNVRESKRSLITC